MIRFFLFLFISLFSITTTVNAKIIGPSRGLHSVLKKKLHILGKHFRGDVHITPHGGCRLRGNKMAPKSYHRIAVGCKAADVYINGVPKKKILEFWQSKGWGGTGYYCGRHFVHVDIGPKRSWTWFCGKKGNYVRR